VLGSPLAVPIGKSRVMQQLRAELQQLAANPAAVLLIGEPGSGREAIARYIHERSPRAAAPFVTLIASTLREADAEARLFGQERLDGDVPVPGLLEEAANGTLFIHEVEDLPPGAQRLLFGVFETGEFTRLGGAETLRLRARVLSSAQPGIEQRAGTETLRRDLLACLNVLIMRVPPLRDYAEDVPELLRHQVDRVVDADGLPFRRFSVAAQNRLRNYPWPDNVRELRHLVHRLLIHGGPEEIRLEEIERELAVQVPPGEPLVKQDLLALPLREAREQFERAYLQQQLMLCNGKVGQLAKRVGMERTHLYRKLRSLGVDFRNISED
jgi:two-component system, NtrC family, nitrogen regulation response regulator NtrX